MLYKVGDKVRIKKDLSGISCVSYAMNAFAGRVVTISDSSYGWYYIVEDNNKWGWSSDMMIEGLAEEEWKPVEGELVETEDGKRIYLYTSKKGQHIIVGLGDDDKYRKGEMMKTVAKKTVKRISEKKERKLMMTDKEWEDFKTKNNINE